MGNRKMMKEVQMVKILKRSLMLFVGIVCLSLGIGLQAAFSETSNEALERRIEQLEKKLDTYEKEAKPLDKPGNDIMDKVSIGGVVAGAYQHQSADNAPAGFDDDTGRGAFVFEPEIGFALTESDEIFVKFGFGAGNALNDGTSPFTYAPWASDLEDDMKNINGRDRDYLLTAWYKHIFEFSDNNKLGLTGGLIDTTDYLDANAYANDEFTQFMNQALVNGPNGFFPSYDLGGALEWEAGDFAIKGVVMNVGENDDNRSYNFYGGEIGYTLQTGLGEGNYRLIVDWTSKDFNDPQGINKESLSCVLLSFDQQLSENLGVWIRFGRQDDSAAIICEELYSGGIDISGKLWGREEDNIGVGYAYLGDGNQNLDKSQVLEAYYRFLLNEYCALTADMQYVKDAMKVGESPQGFISGLRIVVEF